MGGGALGAILPWLGVVLIGLNVVYAARRLERSPDQRPEMNAVRREMGMSLRLALFGVTYAVTASTDWSPVRLEALVPGTVLIIAGVAVRSIAIAYETSGATLERSGLYSVVRHPRYWGTSAIFVGFALLRPAVAGGGPAWG